METAGNVAGLIHRVFGSGNNSYYNTRIEGDPRLQNAWKKVTEFMSPGPVLTPPEISTLSGYGDLRAAGHDEILCKWYIECVRKHFYLEATRVLDKQRVKSAKLLDGFNETIDKLNTLESIYYHYCYPVEQLSFSKKCVDKFKRSLQQLSTEAISDDELFVMLKFIYVRVLISKEDRQDLFTALIVPKLEFLRHLGMNYRVDSQLARIAVNQLRIVVGSLYKSKWDVSVLDDIQSTIDTTLGPLLSSIVSENDQEFCHALFDVATKELVRLRSREMFDIIVDFPESVPAILDLRKCLDTPEQRRLLVETFQQSCKQRLLHAGASTSSIIQTYIAIIQAFKLLDPRAVLLSRVSRQIRRYLRERHDCVTCIIDGLMDEPGTELSSLHEQLKETRPEGMAVYAQGEEDYDDTSWVPDPVDATTDYRTSKSMDILDSLLSLFDSKDAFIREITIRIANRLLNLNNYDIDKETMLLELFKLRFGEAAMSNAEVMVRDILESRRIDKGVHNQTFTETKIAEPFHSNILSRLFWPSFKEEKILLPDVVESQMRSYSEAFQKLKPSRKLRFLKNSGTVDLSLELADRTVNVTVSPFHAAVIYLFEQKDQYNMGALEELTSIVPEKLILILKFWINHGVIKERSSSVYQLLEYQEEDTSPKVRDDEGLSSAVQTAEDKAAEEMEIYWSYIVGMLTNLGSLPVVRIQSLLAMFVPAETPYTRSAEELTNFLNQMVEEEKLTLTGGGYRLRK